MISKPKPVQKPLHVVIMGATLLLAGLIALPAGGRQERTPPSRQTRESGDSTRIEIQQTSNQNAPTTPQQQPAEEKEPSRQQNSENTVPINRPAWLVTVHRSTQNMQQEISKTIDTGYIPVGMEVDVDGSFTVLYTIAAEMVPERWMIETYQPDEVNEELTTRLLEGWNPLGFSVLNDQIGVMYGSGASEISAWRIHETKLNEEELLATIRSYKNDGYSLVDISIDPEDEVLWYLFVQQEGRPSGRNSRLFLNAYPKGENTIAGISTDYTAGRGMPYGIAIGDAVSLVPFITPVTEKE